MMLDAALSWASKGYYVFPCLPLSKEPATTNGFMDATTDPEIIRAWWTQNPFYNIGVSPSRSGMFVVDIDPPRGEDTLAELELQHGMLPATLCFRSPRGGRHLWFRGRCPSSVGTDRRGLGPKLDTRGHGGYVLLPPSHVTYENGHEGVYSQYGTEEIADGPAWIAEIIGRRREEHSAASDVELDNPAALERADVLLHGYVRDNDIAVSGAGGNDRTYQLACEVLNLGLRPGTAYDRIRRIWNPACEPPWDDDELATIVSNAADYSQNDLGAWAVKPGSETFADFARTFGSNAESEADSRSRYYPYELTDVEAFEPPEWLIPDLIPKRGTVQITGKQKSFKTFLVLDMVLGIAAGCTTFGSIPESAPVIYIAGENASQLALAHVPAWCMANDQMPELLPFRIVREMPHAAQPDEMIEFVREIKKLDIRPAVVVIDTATRALRGLDENNAKDMGQFSAACEMIQRELECTVIVIRHTGKDVARGGRGSNVIEGDFDTILFVDRKEDDSFEPPHKTMFVTLTVKDQRNAAEREEPFAFEMVPLGQSLIARPISAGELKDATRKEDPFDRPRIGAVLTKLGAISPERSLSTYVLATELTPQVQSESREEYSAAVKRVERALRKRAKTSLAGYCAGEGSSLAWFAAPLEGDRAETV